MSLSLTSEKWESIREWGGVVSPHYVPVHTQAQAVVMIIKDPTTQTNILVWLQRQNRE